MDGFFGEIRLMAFNFTPQMWVPCNGQVYQIGQYQALAAVVGRTYGGDGVKTFAVPNLNGRTAVAVGDNPQDLFDPILAEAGGNPKVSLTTNNTPPHSHSVNGATLTQTARVAAPSGNYLAPVAYLPTSGNPENAKGFASPPAQARLDDRTLSFTGGTSEAHENRQPYLAMQYYICVEGVWPERP